MRSTLTPFTLSLVFLIAPIATAQTPMGTVFTYQGELASGGVPVDEPLDGCDFEFSLWDADIDGSQVGPTLTPNVLVADGRFTVVLDFGADIFTGAARWLEIAVCCPAPCGGFTTLAPRQELTPAPYSLHTPSAESAPWSGLTGVPAGFADDIDDDALSGLSCAEGEIAKWDGAAWVCGADIDTDTDTTYDGTDFALSDQSCAPGDVVTGVDANGAVICDPDADADTLGALSCGAGEIAKWNNGTAQWECAADEAGAGGANTLDEAYDGGGAGAGRTIIADAGAVEILGAGGLTVAATITSGSSITIDGTANTINSTADLGLQTAGGNVGIGTTEPGRRLDVVGADPVAGTGTITSSGTTVTGSGTAFTSELHEGDILIAGGQEKCVKSIATETNLTTSEPFVPAVSGSFMFQQPIATFSDSDGEAAVIVNAEGNVGIAAECPEGRLHVEGPSPSEDLLQPAIVAESSNAGAAIEAENSEGAITIEAETSGGGALSTDPTIEADNSSPGSGSTIEADNSAGTGNTIEVDNTSTGGGNTIEGDNSAGTGNTVDLDNSSAGAGNTIEADNSAGTGDTIVARNGGAPVPGNAGRAITATAAPVVGSETVFAESTGAGRAGFFKVNNPANDGPALEGRTNSTMAGAFGVLGLATGDGPSTVAVFGNNLSTMANAKGVEGIASAKPVAVVNYGVKGKSNSTNPGAAGVLAEGNGAGAPGVPNAAALEINNGAIRVTGDSKPADTFTVGPDPDDPKAPPFWFPHIISTGLGCSLSGEACSCGLFCAITSQAVQMGAYLDETYMNDLITPDSIVLLTVAGVPDVVDSKGIPVGTASSCYATVVEKLPGSVKVRVSAIGTPDPTEPEVKYIGDVLVHILIIN